MNQQFLSFFEALKGADAVSKVIIGISGVALISAVAVVGMLSSEPHFEVTFPGLTDSEFASISSALAEAGIEMRGSRGDGVNVVLTAAEDNTRAQTAVALAGVYDASEKGILGSEGSITSVFASATEREQQTRARETSEVEKMIEVLDYITQAELILPPPETGVLTRKRDQSAAVVVRTVGGRKLDSEESLAVARCVQFGIGVHPDNLSITDQNGHLFFGGGEDDSSATERRVLDLQRDYNAEQAMRVNDYLTSVLGPDKARVMVNSEFDHTMSTTVTHGAEEGVELNSRTIETETPQGGSGGAGGFPGTDSNLAGDGEGWAVDNVGQVSPGASEGLATATSSETEKSFFVPTTNRTEVSDKPTLKRLSVSLTLDEAVASDEVERDEIANLVKASLGFDELRGDSFEVHVRSMPQAAVLEPGAEGETVGEPAAGGGGMSTDVLIERGVEIATALAFILLLLKGLKGAKTQTPEQQAAAASESESLAEVEISPELLARAQVEDLVQNNPERVAQILSTWVVEDRAAVKS